MSQQDSFASVKRKSGNKSLDICVEKSSDYSFKDYKFTYDHTRHLPKTVANKAIKYIIAIVAVYPFQARVSLAKPLWDRFCQEWCVTGDESKSLGAI